MRSVQVLLAALLLAPAPPAQEEVSRIAFGSCYRGEGPAEVWDAIAAWEPDVFLMIGDNVYADTEDMALMRERYRRLSETPGFAALRGATTFLATWDDHDYGANDAGADYPAREESRRVFLEFCGEPEDSERSLTPGVYASRTMGPAGSRVQIVLLDTRYFRSPLERGEEAPEAALGHPGPYVPSIDPERTMLGAAQWAWLAERLREPAELRIVVSSIQVVAEDHRYETWANLPLERKRLLELVRDTGAGGVIFVSGDRHKAELSVLDPSRAGTEWAVDVGYPLHDLTSSSLNAPSSPWNELNRHRVGSEVNGANFGTIEIAWSLPDPRVTLRLHEAGSGKAILRRDVKLSQLRP